MTTLERIDQDFKEAMKARAELHVSVLRLVRTALKNKQIEAQHELAEAEVQAVLKTMIKQYQDALSDFENAGRRDLVERQQAEIDLLAKYLPPPLSLTELEDVVRGALKGTEITDVGRAIGVAMKAVAGRADGNEVRKIVERLLTP
jgi:uncharacterized protein YqeY